MATQGAETLSRMAAFDPLRTFISKAPAAGGLSAGGALAHLNMPGDSRILVAAAHPGHNKQHGEQGGQATEPEAQRVAAPRNLLELEIAGLEALPVEIALGIAALGRARRIIIGPAPKRGPEHCGDDQEAQPAVAIIHDAPLCWSSVMPTRSGSHNGILSVI